MRHVANGQVVAEWFQLHRQVDPIPLPSPLPKPVSQRPSEGSAIHVNKIVRNFGPRKKQFVSAKFLISIWVAGVRHIRYAVLRNN